MANKRVGAKHALGFAVISVLIAWGSPAVAQFAPDAGAIMRETDQLRAPQEPRLSPRTIAPAPVKPDPTAVQFMVKSFRLTGVTLVPIAELQTLLKPWLNREITFEDLDRALAAIANFYQDRGWFVRPQLPAQDIVGGVVTINVIEAKL
ncbi:MAG TPA: POTRA domain-containing protein, partial [Orrella sp.]